MVPDNEKGTLPPLLIVGLNSALQKRFIIKDRGNLVPGQVHRASHVQTGVGGKGQDVAIALNCLTSESAKAFCLLQFLGDGAEGDEVLAMLQRQMGAEAVHETTIRVQSSLRTCTSIVGQDNTTELVEPSGHILAEEVQELLERVGSLTTSGLCVMGSMPPGCPPTLYADIYKRAAKSSTLCVMDTVAGVSQLFAALTGPALYKVNAHELNSLAGADETTDVATAIPAFLNKFQPPPELQAVAITDGKNPAYLCWLDAKRRWFLFQLSTPQLDTTKQTLYPIGAGDAVAAGTLAAWVKLETAGQSNTGNWISTSCHVALQQFIETDTPSLPKSALPSVAAFAFGLSCGSASCLQEENSVLEESEVLRLFSAMPPPTLVHESEF